MTRLHTQNSIGTLTLFRPLAKSGFPPLFVIAVMCLLAAILPGQAWAQNNNGCLQSLRDRIAAFDADLALRMQQQNELREQILQARDLFEMTGACLDRDAALAFRQKNWEITRGLIDTISAIDDRIANCFEIGQINQWEFNRLRAILQRLTERSNILINTAFELHGVLGLIPVCD